MPEQLRSIIEFMEQASETMKITGILKSLHFSSMNDRFRHVQDSAPDTFGWLFEDSEKLLSMEPDLKISFKEWLRSGRDIFHFSGKPGSGKSTLMKYICEHDEVEGLLNEWGGDRKVICAQFFFWRVGSVDERSLSGLVRGLLFAVIQQEPDLAHRLFPGLWKSGNQNSGTSSFIKLKDRDISDAFDKMVQSKLLLEKFRICFFVDGLDEFEPTGHGGHDSLARKIRTWTVTSGGSVKFCVASREMPAFEGAFSSSQRITLQTFNKEDIFNLVEQRLGENELFHELQQKHERECEELMDTIVKDAEGVILWVALVLTQLEESLANGDPITMLQRILSQAPKGLDAFLLTILESIPEQYQESAYTVLAVVLRANGTLLADKQREPKYDAVTQMLCENIVEIDLCACSLLFEISDRGDLSNLPVDFLEEGGKISPELVKARILSAGSQLKARCRGLLEAREDKVIFTHRSIPEFLQRNLNQKVQSYHIDDHQVSERFAWMAVVEKQYGRKPYDTMNPKTFKEVHEELVEKALEMTAMFRELEWKDSTRAFNILHMFDEMLFPLHSSNSPGYKFGLIENYEGTNDGSRESWRGGGVLTTAAVIGLHEYIAWVLGGNKYTDDYAVNALASFISFDHGYYPYIFFQEGVLEAFFCGGVSANTLYPAYGDNINGRNSLLWHHWLIHNIFFASWKRSRPRSEKPVLEAPSDAVWSHIQIWLRHGADPDLTLTLMSQGIEPAASSDNTRLLAQSGQAELRMGLEQEESQATSSTTKNQMSAKVGRDSKFIDPKLD